MNGGLLAAISATRFTDRRENPVSSQASPPHFGPPRWMFGDLLQWKGEAGFCGGKQ